MRSLCAAVLGLLLASVCPSDALAQAPPKRLVVIDAGHGGVDPGALGASGKLEKTIALQVATQLATLLRADSTLVVRMTRETDTLIPLRERPRLANFWRNEQGAGSPALFLSIHANAHDRRAVRGFETYFLSEAVTEDARRVAALENSAERFEGSPTAGDPLGFILNDLRQNHYLRESSEGAALIQRNVGGVHPGPDRGVKQASFVVLDGSFMPAVLVELGFITNPDEEAILASPEYQRRVAQQLASAVADFFGRPSVAGSAGAY